MKVTCIKDVIMLNTENRTFTKGKMYEIDEYEQTINDNNDRHTICSGSNWFYKHFVKMI